MARSLRHSLARIGRWPRILAAVTCLLLAAVSALEAHQTHAVARTRVRTSPVVVARQALPAGHTLRSHDVAVKHWPAALVPAGARAGPSTLVGQRLAVPIGAGEPLTATRVVGVGLTDGLRAGTVATPVELDADVRAFLRAGDRLDLVVTDRPDTDPLDSTAAPRSTSSDTTAMVVAHHLLVLAIYRVADSSPPSAQVVLATSRELAVRIAALRTNRLFTIVADPP